MKRVHNFAFLMFMAGLFSQTQVRIVGSISISELIFFITFPYFYFKDMRFYRQERISAFLRLAFLTVLGTLIACVANNTPFGGAIRGLATWLTLLVCFVGLYYFIRRDPDSFKWYLLGSALSYVVCIFIFQQGVEVAIAERQGYYGDDVSAAIQGSAIFWIGRLSGFVFWPIQAYYLTTPLLYSIAVPIGFSAFSLFSTASGRSSALVTLFTIMLICICGKKIERMRMMRKHIFLILAGMMLCGIAFKVFYTNAASTGMLGDDAQKKFEEQTKGKTSVLAVLMGGRIQCFAGAYAALHKPILGYGPWAEDKDNLFGRFLLEYGDTKAYGEYMERYRYYLQRGAVFVMPSHSCLVGGWIDAGIFGLIFWLYAIYLLFDCLLKRMAIVPEFFGYLATAIPVSMWNIFFSPIGLRISWAFFFAMILYVRSVSFRKCLYVESR